MDDAHIIYYHMNAFQSVVLACSYISHPNYLVVQCWISAVVLFPDLINLKGDMFYIFEVFPWVVGHMHEGTPFHHFKTIVDIAYHVVITASPLLTLLIICKTY